MAMPVDANNIRKCRELIKKFEKKKYFSAALVTYNSELKKLEEEFMRSGAEKDEAASFACKKILSHLHNVMRDAEPLVEDVIKEKVKRGEITNADQARKSTAGNIFQQMFAYILAQNILIGNLPKDLMVTTSSSSIIEQYAAIHVGDDIQMPDSDVLVYSETDNKSPIVNFSCKTSCRERAGQTYKWKLLCDLATCHCKYKRGNLDCPTTKYNLSYSPTRPIKMCFVTTDFYNELTNPQICAMFNFFDSAYVAKAEAPAGKNIKTLDHVIDDIKSIFK